jgi:hypothetical protein
VDLSDLLGKFGGLSGGRRELNRQLRVVDAEGIACISRILGVDLARLSKLAGEDVQMKANASFEEGRSGTTPNTAGDAGTGRPRKARKRRDAWRESRRHP